MTAHWVRHAVPGMQTLCWLWSRDARRLVRIRWVRRETALLIRAVGEAVWAQPQRKRRAPRG